jgi:hypothetical protein
MKKFTHCGRDFLPLGASGAYYAATHAAAGDGLRVEVEPRQCPQFPSAEAARRWAEEMDALETVHAR